MSAEQRYRVIVELIQVKAPGSIMGGVGYHHVYRNGLVPDGADPRQLKHLLDNNMIEPIGEANPA